MTQKEIEKFLANTKVYVAGKSKEIQEKLLSLGCSWGLGLNTVLHTDKPFLFIWEDKIIGYSDNMNFFTNNQLKEITADEILSLELAEPTYRPFKDKEECWQEMLKHQPFGWLKSKMSGSIAHLGHISQFGKEVHVMWSTNETEYGTSDSTFEDYTFADGTPFGIKEE